MKKISVILSLVAITATSLIYTGCNNSSASGSDSNFEGVLTYEIKGGAGLPPEVANMFQTMTMKTYVKGNMARTDESMAGSANSVIADNKKPGDRIVLMSLAGHNYAVRPSDSMKKIEMSNIPQIEYIDSSNATKQIAGYLCKKAKVTITMPKQGSEVTYVYYTTDLPYADPQGTFKGLKGMPMEYSVNMEGLNIIFSVKSVEKKNLSDSLFTVPSGYKEISLEELQKQFTSSMASDTTQPQTNQ